MTDRLPRLSIRAGGAGKHRWKLFGLLTGLAAFAILWSVWRSRKLHAPAAGNEHAWEPWLPDQTPAPSPTLADAEARARADIEAALPTDDAPSPSGAKWETDQIGDAAPAGEAAWAVTAAPPLVVDDLDAAVETIETTIAETPPLDTAPPDAAMLETAAILAGGHAELEGQARAEAAPAESGFAPTGDDAVGWVEVDGLADCPPGFPIKGNASSKIFHRPGESSYAATVPEICFATEADAELAGYRERKR